MPIANIIIHCHADTVHVCAYIRVYSSNKLIAIVLLMSSCLSKLQLSAALFPSFTMLLLSCASFCALGDTPFSVSSLTEIQYIDLYSRSLCTVSS